MTKHRFHRGVRLHGDVLRETRLAQGLRQAQLAKQAGVAERTVRKAESGQVIEKHIADYICTVLHLSLEDTMQAMATKQRTPSSRLKASRFDRNLQKALLDDDADPFLASLHPEIQWRCITSMKPSIHESISGKAEAMELISRIREWMRKIGICKRTEEIIHLQSAGDLLYVHSEIHFTQIDPSKARREPLKQTLQCWSAKVIRFDDGLIRNLEHFWGELPGQPQSHNKPTDTSKPMS